MTQQDPTETFALSVRAFAEWVVKSKESGAPAARQLLVMLLNLYSQCLALPSRNPTTSPEKRQQIKGEFTLIYRKGKRLPVGYYGEVFDPLPVPPQEPVVGDLSDDLADIYFELVSGLQLYDRNQIDDAVWTWKFGLESHWGEHATGAIRVLHCWLARNYELGVFPAKQVRRRKTSNSAIRPK